MIMYKNKAEQQAAEIRTKKILKVAKIGAIAFIAFFAAAASLYFGFKPLL